MMVLLFHISILSQKNAAVWEEEEGIWTFRTLGRENV